MRQAFLQFRDTGGQVGILVGLIGKVHDDRFIFRVRSLHQVEGCFIHSLPLGAHGAGVVHQDRQRDGKILVLKRSDGLLYAVLGNLEVVLLQVLDQVSVIVDYGRRQNHFFYIARQGELTPFAATDLTCTAALCRRRRSVFCRLTIGRTNRVAVDRQRLLLLGTRVIRLLSACWLLGRRRRRLCQDPQVQARVQDCQTKTSLTAKVHSIQF